MKNRRGFLNVSLWGVTFAAMIWFLALGGEANAFGGRPAPLDPSAPVAPDSDPSEPDKTADGVVTEPSEEPTDPPIYSIEPPPEDIWSEPLPDGGEFVTTAAPNEPHQPRDVPEPGTLGLAGIGLAFWALSLRFRERNRS